MNNNQTCIHQGVAPITFQECIHLVDSEDICPICAYEIGFIEGCNKKWSDYAEYISSEHKIIKCSLGTIAIKSQFKIIANNKSEFTQGICINCSFKLGFEAGCKTNEMKEIELYKVATPEIIKVKIIDYNETCI